MTREIRLYIEGGGDGRNTKSLFRRAFGELLRNLRELAQAKKVRWEIIACGSRGATFDAFKTALKAHRDAFNVLLVDSETAVNLSPWQHLLKGDGWAKPDGAEDRHCHFMAQAMEAWLIADAKALAEFYGNGFNLNALPNQPDVEQISKSQLVGCLNKAARGTNKPKYHKIQHACKILEFLDLEVVASRARHCRRFVKEMTEEINALG